MPVPAGIQVLRVFKLALANMPLGMFCFAQEQVISLLCIILCYEINVYICIVNNCKCQQLQMFTFAIVDNEQILLSKSVTQETEEFYGGLWWLMNDLQG